MILIVDDDASNRSSVKQVLTREKWECIEAADGNEAIQILRDNPHIQLLITDMKMPGINGLELLQTCRNIRPDVQRLLITAFGTIEATVEAMRAGAFDVLTKPVKMKALRESVKALLDRVNPHTRPQEGESHAISQRMTDTTGQLSPEYAALSEKLRKAARSEASVLFTGESGTGKSFLATLLHKWSKRSGEKLITLNCAAIPAELLESELFGYEKGAFTGAQQSRQGKVEAAHNGTLFLDEIGDLSLALQAKLLEVIQEKRFFKLGSSKQTSVNIRIVSASNRNLEEMVDAGQFRKDLLYRLKVIDIQVPSLRDRKQDLLWLIPNLLDSLAEKNGLPTVRLTHAAMEKLWNYSWPGNVRELENVLESTLVLTPEEDLREGMLDALSLPEDFLERVDLESGTSTQTRKASMPLMADLRTIEKQAIEQALTLCGGKRKVAASLLGVSERTLYRALGSDKA